MRRSPHYLIYWKAMYLGRVANYSGKTYVHYSEYHISPPEERLYKVHDWNWDAFLVYCKAKGYSVYNSTTKEIILRGGQ